MIKPSITEATRDETRDFVDRLVAYNRKRAGSESVAVVELALRDEAGNLRGGVRALRSWRTLLIDALWVDEDIRGRGYGSSLLATAEKRGLELGCEQATLETFSFQSEPFYHRRGYRSVGVVKEWPPGGHLSRMVKVLTG